MKSPRKTEGMPGSWLSLSSLGATAVGWAFEPGLLPGVEWMLNCLVVLLPLEEFARAGYVDDFMASLA